VAALFGVGIYFERLSRRRGLSQRFGRYWDAKRAASWAASKEQLAVGATVRGTVVLERHYGSFFDLGLGFPAQLKAIDDLAQPLPRVGDALEVRVLEFDDSEREIVLTRRPPGA
jgi:ribosomal protein S1